MSQESPQRPTVLFDGKCGFCRRHIARWATLSGEAIEYLPFQERGGRFANLADDQLGKALHLIEPDGTVTRGAQAVFQILAIGGKRAGQFCYDRVPGFARCAETSYAFIARQRELVDPLDRALFGKSREPLSHRLTVSIFLRALGVIYLIAFVSLSVQITGLIGSHGILPIAPGMEGLRHNPAAPHVWELPTLCWINASDGFLTFLCIGGAAMAALLAAGVLPGVMLIGLWTFYLSLVVAGQDFLSFQWDSLLLEAGFAALFLAPFQWWISTRTMREPSHIGLWLMRWLAFRIMFLSGLTKLNSGDVSWREGTALSFHYWTQPLPPWTAWYVNQLPLAFSRFSCWMMFFAELAIPFFIFTPRIPRRIAFFGIVLFQLIITVTGNYGFFNILTIVLCIPLLEDSFFPANWRGKPSAHRQRPVWSTLAMSVPALTLLLITTVAFASEVQWQLPFPQWMRSLHELAYPFRSANGYGLFRVMTKQRYELVIEGSDDGEHWKAYDFKYKPGDVDRRPGFVTPHMPRLDWQMWFAALDDQPPRWFIAFLQRLLEGSSQVEGLLRTNPFPDHPPRYVHVLRYDYQFADDRHRKAWWKRTLLGDYVPTVRLR